MAGEIFVDLDLSRKIETFNQFKSIGHHETSLISIENKETSKKAPWFEVGEFSLIDNSRFIGVEVEVENVNLDHFMGKSMEYPMWNSKNDSSLRNNGLEFVSIPMRGARVIRALQFLKYALNPQIEFTSRTSVHIHVNVRDFTLAQLISLALIYACSEKLLFKWIGFGRATNIFCVPISETRDLSALYSAIRDHLEHAISYKYSALNMNPCTPGADGSQLLGTVEFRHMRGTLDIETLVNWINLILSIVQYAKKHQLPEILKTIVELNTTSSYGIFIKKIFGEQAHLLLDLVTSPDHFLKLMEASVMEVKRSTFTNEFHHTLFLGYPSSKSPMVKALRKKYGPFSIENNYGKKLSGGNSSPGSIPLPDLFEEPLILSEQEAQDDPNQPQH